ncbi:MAG: hypothetical protein KA163_08990 [Bacteroidia bacterium]|nr:hypothetical protein [Bacteroidia bacterium]
MKKLFTAAFVFMTTFLSAQVNYIYSDGSSNNYIINETLIKYDPVTKENSSSGTYSGGEAKSKSLSKSDFEKISTLFKEAFAAKAEQQTDRAMMTGLLIHKKGKKTIQQVVIKPNSPYIGKIEALLKSLL